MATNLRNLMAPPPVPLGRPAAPGIGPDLDPEGMAGPVPPLHLYEAGVAFRFPLPATDPDPDRRLRAAWATGEMDEDSVLDRMAARRGLERVDLTKAPPDPALQALLDPAFCLHHQIVPWRSHDGLLICATARPESYMAVLAPLAHRLRQTRRLGLRPVVVRRDQIQGAVARASRAELSARMAARVPLGESCRNWAATAHRLRLTLGLGALALALLIARPDLVLVLLTGWAVLTMVLAMVLKGAAATRCLLHPPPGQSRAAPAPAPLAEADLPEISILVPLFRERCIAAALLRRLARLDYPRDRLEVVLVLEEADTITRDTIAALTLPPWIRCVVVPGGHPQTKPRAMNYALDFCRGEIVGIYDAEDAPDPDQLRQVAARFATAPPEVACLQGALDYYNPRQSWLARCFTVEYNTWFRLILPGMAGLGFPIPLGGTTLFMRRPALEALGGWDAHNVTEDADLGMRIARHGYRTELLATTTREEAACHPLPWIKQRSRWLKGYIVTYLVHLRRPARLHRQLGLWRSIGFHAHFITAVSQFMLAPLLWSFWLMLAGLPHPLLALVPPALLKTCAVLFFCAEVQNIALGLIATRRAEHRHLWPWVPTMHLYYPLGCLAVYKALYELVVKPFYWDKTQHGHSLRHPRAGSASAAEAGTPGRQSAPEPDAAPGADHWI
ncbi:glycosyltransferase family 2 protein [Pseudooceanicola sp. 200-1SW]|uniref:glycosyltransferase family 2 protein n=1 Tax=Pseudooceanicola sp. 200-1SW TaxID=3425949 RepID=UPI003D7FB653